MLAEGEKAPNFSLKDFDGNERSLDEFKGKYVVLYFYPRDNTPGCTIEAKGFNATLTEFKNAGAEIIGVSKDSVESHCKFRDKLRLKFLLLSDPESTTIKRYGAYGNRGIFGVGTLRTTFVIGKDGTILKVFQKVKPAGHNKEVLALLK